jgi:hypothetical protein
MGKATEFLNWRLSRRACIFAFGIRLANCYINLAQFQLGGKNKSGVA